MKAIARLTPRRSAKSPPATSNLTTTSASASGTSTSSAEAVLGPDGLWRSSDPLLAKLLNVRYSPDDRYSDGDGYGRGAVREAAAALGMDLYMEPLAPLPEGAVS